ncbi:uncharacterized protein LOC101453508 [Ceratitis capitata]|uniref:uncharacterized protein LOC101453508 n=1 Tax=Ceratitis capitata TaxID=7213 RepID=UPI0003298B6F|nr:uncharacterized protein LOC101453508 [Ceratitis capitata]
MDFLTPPKRRTARACIYAFSTTGRRHPTYSLLKAKLLPLKWFHSLDWNSVGQYFSQTWLEKPPWTWKAYVSNRISEILQEVNNAIWRHVPISHNPADLGTRGIKFQELVNSPLWWFGPEWLTKPSEFWPKTAATHSSPPEQLQADAHHAAENADLLERFSSYPRALRVVGYILRFVNKAKGLPASPSRCMSQDEMNQAKTFLMWNTQHQHYGNTISTLSASKPINKKDPLLTLTPFLDKAGVLRVNRRLSYAALSYNERHPIIIPSDSRLCTLILAFLHSTLLHVEKQLMIRMKQKIKTCIFHCKPCTLYKQKTKTQMMVALPPEHTTYPLPFQTTGVDFAGPFLVKTSTLRTASYSKAYACVFVCFITKAIHPELCSDLSTEAFKAAFARFLGRRGILCKIMSDNGRTFIGVKISLNKDLIAFLVEISAGNIPSMASPGKFIPPYAPHMGGLWEATVKSFKIHFTKIANNHKFTFGNSILFSCVLKRS